MAASLLWAVSVPLQTAILGHLPGPDASDAIAEIHGNDTHQYLKVVVRAMVLGNGIADGTDGRRGNLRRIRSDARLVSWFLNLCVGIVLAVILFSFARTAPVPLQPDTSAMRLGDQIMIVMCFVLVGMAYQMPVCNGDVLRGSGDTKFSLILNTVSVWAIVMPPPCWPLLYGNCLCRWSSCSIQSDQIF